MFEYPTPAPSIPSGANFVFQFGFTFIRALIEIWEKTRAAILIDGAFFRLFGISNLPFLN